MPSIAPFPAPGRRRAALLALAARSSEALAADASSDTPSAEEAEFIEALRRIVGQNRSQELFDRYHRTGDRGARIFARYAD